ncbi:hypothetical protein C8R47DRAFT_1081554 [Mycena vitilis]|nr:hypothetical protein C8R47DRAFT_1081554 [Mycena vitilis]
MIVAEGDSKSARMPSPPAERAGEPSRAPSDPPPAYSPGTDGPTSPIAVQQSPELPSAFRPPSPSSFPHLYPQTGPASSGPTPFFHPAAAPATDGQYAYYDPRSTYSIALADRRAFVRFWTAFAWAMAVLLLLWTLGLIQFR